MSYDVTKLYRAINNFYRISGMEIAVGDRNRHGLTSSRCDGCNFCGFVHSFPGALSICSSSDMEHIYEMERTHSPVVYTCPLGIEEVLLPIMRDGELDGYLFCSMGVLDECGDGDARAEELCRGALGISGDELLLKIRSMPHFTLAERDAYLGVLKALGRYIETEGLLPDKGQTIGQLVKNYIKENIKRKITLSDIARTLHCSTVTITEHFRREFGVSVMQYVLKKRMELAPIALSAEDTTIAEAARTVGFSDVEYFSRCFKRHFGLSPRDWKKAHEGA